MKKYDCSKTEEFAHEAKRMCATYSSNCSDCPLYDLKCGIEDIDDLIIKRVQNWSDTHPEDPKLTRKEYDFLSSFKRIDNRYICRGAGACYVFIPDMDCQIRVVNDMFRFIQEGIGNGWSFEKLLVLEVEDEK